MQGKVQIHWVTDGNRTKGWVHTHGMDEHGLPELEVRDIPGFLAEDAASLLNHVCEYMRESERPVRLGETMATSDRTRFRFVQSVPIPGNEEHYETLRWQLVDVECACENCGLKPSERN